MAANKGEGIVVTLGTMTFGWQRSSTFLDDKASRELVEKFVAAGHTELDSALMYSDGETEKILGRMMAESPELAMKTHIATKANPSGSANLTAVMSAGGSATGGFSEDQLRAQVDMSLASLKMDKVPLLYLHMPDTATAIAPTLATLTKLRDEGKFDELGISNYAAWEVANMCRLADANNWIKPTVYQCMYNAVTRSVEAELVVVCRRFGLRLRVYNPLAGGILTGRHIGATTAPEGRFKDNAAYLDRFWKPSFFQAIDLIKQACDDNKITMGEAAFRWLKFHSQLTSGDGIIIGASNEQHLIANLESCAVSQPLPQAVVVALDGAWEIARKDCPSYFRGFSAME